MPFDQRGVYREVAASGVLDEEGDIRRLVEDLSSNEASTGDSAVGTVVAECFVVRVFTSAAPKPIKTGAAEPEARPTRPNIILLHVG